MTIYLDVNHFNKNKSWSNKRFRLLSAHSVSCSLPCWQDVKSSEFRGQTPQKLLQCQEWLLQYIIILQIVFVLEKKWLQSLLNYRWVVWHRRCSVLHRASRPGVYKADFNCTLSNSLLKTFILQLEFERVGGRAHLRQLFSAQGIKGVSACTFRQPLLLRRCPSVISLPAIKSTSNPIVGSFSSLLLQAEPACCSQICV